MNRFCTCGAVLGVLWFVATPTLAAQNVTGVVFDDRNANGIREAGEQGIAGVCVSNGEGVVKTDALGRYRLPVEGDAIVFVTKPAGWKARLDDRNTPLFYYVHSPAGSPKLKYAGVKPTGPLPESVDFPLVKAQDARRFDVLVFGDSQPYTGEQVDFLSHEIAESLVGVKAAFGVTLGDVVGDNLEMHPAVAESMSKIGLRWHYVAGNHDRNYDAASDELSYEFWKAHYGPTYYSFDEGKAHFVVLEDIMRTSGTGYKPAIGAKQLRWLKSDLAATPKDRLVVLMMHIPLLEPLDEKKEILAAIAPFKNTLSLGAHWHTQSHQLIGAADGWPNPTPHNSLAVGTTCGCWWSGELDETGLPMALMSDGTPQGYLWLKIDGTGYKLRYQVSRRPSDYQMNIVAPDSKKASELVGAEVVANVFLASANSKVEMCVDDGAWTPMVRDERVDPNVDRIDKLQKAKTLPATGSTIGSGKSDHIWVGKLPILKRGTHVVTVRATDVFGQVSTGRRFVRVL